jgi:hypothetical protein
LDNVIRNPGYLKNYKVLLLSYEFMKPLQPGIHQILSEWVANGGTLIYVGADTDPFHQVREWWNQSPNPSPAFYAAPSQHLFERLGLERTPKEGEYHCGKGLVIVERKHPAWFSRSIEGSERVVQLVRRGVEAAGGQFVERNGLQLRRGPYVIAAALTESVGKEPMSIEGRFIDLLDPRLPVRENVALPPGERAWLLDLNHVTAKAPAMLAAAGRVETWTTSTSTSTSPATPPAASNPASNSTQPPTGQSVSYTIKSPEGVNVVARILLPSAPKAITVAGQPCKDFEWHEPSKTLLLRHPGSPNGVEVGIEW